MEDTVLRAKRRFFAKYFDLYFNRSSSVARMRKGHEGRVFKGVKPKTINIQEDR